MQNIIQASEITVDVINTIVDEFFYDSWQDRKAAIDAVKNAVVAETDLNDLVEVAREYSLGGY